MTLSDLAYSNHFVGPTSKISAIREALNFCEEQARKAHDPDIIDWIDDFLTDLLGTCVRWEEEDFFGTEGLDIG